MKNRSSENPFCVWFEWYSFFLILIFFLLLLTELLKKYLAVRYEIGSIGAYFLFIVLFLWFCLQWWIEFAVCRRDFEFLGRSLMNFFWSIYILYHLHPWTIPKVAICENDKNLFCHFELSRDQAKFETKIK